MRLLRGGTVTKIVALVVCSEDSTLFWLQQTGVILRFLPLLVMHTDVYRSGSAQKKLKTQKIDSAESEGNRY